MDLVIVNADDWGLNRAHTNAIAKCMRAERVTSATAMVFMAGSEHAAALARSEGWPVGIHLNFIDRFDAESVPQHVRDRQSHLVRHFTKGGLHRWTFSPRLYHVLGDVIRDQLAEFTRLYGSAPTHVDGHQHLHQNLTALTSPALSSGLKMRPSFTFLPGEKPWVNRALRASLNYIMRRRFPGPARFLSIRSLTPSLGGTWVTEKLSLLHSGTVEVMVHPGWHDEFAFLMSDDWSEIIRGLTLGSYRDL